MSEDRYTFCPEHSGRSPCADHFPCHGCPCLMHADTTEVSDE